MVDVQATNSKLVRRSERMLAQLTGHGARQRARRAAPGRRQRQAGAAAARRGRPRRRAGGARPQRRRSARREDRDREPAKPEEACRNATPSSATGNASSACWPPASTGSASIRIKAKTHGSVPVLTQACIVPRCTTISPAFIVHGLAVVEFEVAFALEQDRVVERLGAVHEFRRARREFGDADDRALARADIIVAHDKALALRLGGGAFRIVDRHLVGGPDLDARDAGPGRRGGGA